MLATTLQQRNGLLGLPLIRNEKPVDPSSPASPRVYQLETAMGSAIALFDRALTPAEISHLFTLKDGLRTLTPQP